MSFIPGVGPLVAIARCAQNINNAAAVDAARKSLGMSELEFEDYVKAAFTGEYDTGVVGQMPIGSRDYTVGFGGRVTEPTEEGQKAITTLSVPEAQRRAQLAAQQAGRPMEDIMSMTRPTTAAGTTASPTVAGVASQLGRQLEEGVEMMTNIMDCEQTPEALQLDMPLEVTFKRLTDDINLPVFKPAS